MVLGWLFKGLAGKSESETGLEYTARRVQTRTPGVGPSFGNLNDFAVLRRQALQALCGALMDRHSACDREMHPFCGPGHQQDGDAPTQLIAQAVAQRDFVGRTDLIGIYLSPAIGDNDGSGQQDIMDYILTLRPTAPATSKLVVSPPLRDGSGYPALYGPVQNPGGDGGVPAGLLDPGRHASVNANPRPAHCRWHYWDSEVPTQGRTVATFHVLQVFGEWWVVETDAQRGAAQKVAALDLADNPNHK